MYITASSDFLIVWCDILRVFFFFLLKLCLLQFPRKASMTATDVELLSHLELHPATHGTWKSLNCFLSLSFPSASPNMCVLCWFTIFSHRACMWNWGKTNPAMTATSRVSTVSHASSTLPMHYKGLNSYCVDLEHYQVKFNAWALKCHIHLTPQGEKRNDTHVFYLGGKA